MLISLPGETIVIPPWPLRVTVTVYTWVTPPLVKRYSTGLEKFFAPVVTQFHPEADVTVGVRAVRFVP
jgi:hypothetical protein